MKEKDLPKVKEKMTLLDRLFSYRYDELIIEGEEYRDKAKELLREATGVACNNETKKVELAERETELNHREDVVRAKEEGAEKLLDNANKQYEKAVGMAAKVGQEMNKVEETKRALRTLIEGLIAKGADQAELQNALNMLNNLRPDPTAERRITEESATRDDYVMQALLALKQKAKDLKYAFELKQGEYGDDKSNAIYIRDNLRAALVAIVAFYRDTLPEVDATTFYINGQSCIEFLFEQTKKLNMRSDGTWIIREASDDNIQTIMRDVYIDLADRLGYSVYYDNEGDILHGSRERYGYPNYVGMRINRECVEQLPCCFELRKVDERTAVKVPRATVDVAVPSTVEAEINETAKYFEDMDR